MVDLKNIEKKWQQRWKKDKIFEPVVDTEKPKYFITVPYPYTSGPLHIGHGRTYTIGDIFARYKRMRGFNVLFPMAFHVTGTPILAVSRGVESQDPTTLQQYREYLSLYIDNPKKVEETLKSFKDPWKVAQFFSKVISEDYNALGFSIDWTRRFTTCDPSYSRFISWQFELLRRKGFVVQGEYPVLYCLSCDNAVGEDDIEGGDTLDLSIQEYVAIKFPCRDGYLVAATLRPETIFGLTNLWVNPDGEYARVEVDNETWYVSRKAAEKLGYQGHKIKILEVFGGEKLVGSRCRSPVGDEKVLVLPAWFVDTSSGTGVVYSVPAHAPYDYQGLVDLQRNPELLGRYNIPAGEVKKIVPISIISVEGYGDYPAKEVCEKLGVVSQNDRDKLEEATKMVYKAEFYGGVLKNNCQEFAGIKISEIKDRVKDWLSSKGIVTPFYEPATKRLRCRCGGEVLVRTLRDQWFLDYGNPAWKNLAREALERVEIQPEKYRTLFEHTFSWLHARPCARKRGLGTKLPWAKEWIIESLADSTIYMSFYTIANTLNRNNIEAEKLSDKVFDYVFLGLGEPDEVAGETGIPVELLEEMRNQYCYWYPNDHRHTAITHITNHLTFFLFNHAAIFPEDKWPKKITLNEHVIAEGAKMSKSRGNVIPLVEVPRKYSADLFRAYSAGSADLDTVMDWREKDVLAFRRRINRIWELVEEVSHAKTEDETPKTIADRWLLSRFNSALRDAIDHMEHCRVRDYTQTLMFRFVNDVNYYQQRAAEVNLHLLRYVVKRLLLALQPVIPHTSEEGWERLGGRGYASLAPFPEPDESKIDPLVERAEKLVQETLGDIRQIQEVTGITSPKKITIFLSPKWKHVLYLETKKNIGVDRKKLVKKIMENEEIRKHGKEAIKLLTGILEKPHTISEVVVPPEEQKKVFQDATPFLLRETKAGNLEVVDAESFEHPKARQATPTKPGILLE